ncbi:MAG: class I SAM-dependent methyltransferase [Micrococcales bacterium]|nr:class I SAM-dependent methyltransferase [Micrococcales bacterium]
MHRSARALMKQSLDAHLSRRRRYDVIDLGSAISRGQSLTHRDLLEPYLGSYTGVDIKANANVDVLMSRPYTIPCRSRSADVVISGQAFEHIPFPWATAMEIRRVLRPGGLAIITAPSRGHVHDVYDCWRICRMRHIRHYVPLRIMSASWC